MSQLLQVHRSGFSNVTIWEISKQNISTGNIQFRWRQAILWFEDSVGPEHTLITKWFCIGSEILIISVPNRYHFIHPAKNDRLHYGKLWYVLHAFEVDKCSGKSSLDTNHPLTNPPIFHIDDEWCRIHTVNIWQKREWFITREIGTLLPILIWSFFLGTCPSEQIGENDDMTLYGEKLFVIIARGTFYHPHETNFIA